MGDFLGDENCENWVPLGIHKGPGTFSFASDSNYLYAGTPEGVYRYPISAIQRKN
jgi:hypothetical protein